jgi:Na+/proline symporter
LEIIRARWGDTAHKVFFFFALTTNIIVTAMLLLGGASVFSALTGINRYAACMLIPVGVVIKTIWGGLKITYFSSLLSTWIILAAVTVFAFRVYASPGMFLGSPAAVWEHLNIFVSTPEPVGGGAAIAQMRLGPVDGTFLYALHTN